MLKVLSLLFLAMLPSLACATDGYKCTPKAARSLSLDGSLEQNPFPKLLLKLNDSFIVDRESGRMVGSKGFANHNGQFGSPTVLDPGSAEQSFKALTIYRPNAAIAYLEIQQFAEGESKPFIYYGSGVVVTGICVSL